MRTESNKELKWIARIFSGLLILFSLAMFSSYRFFPETAGLQPGKPEPLSTEAVIGLSIAGLGLIGLALAWKWPLFAGIFAIVGFLVLAFMEPILFQSPVAYVYPTSALFFIVLWAKNKDMF